MNDGTTSMYRVQEFAKVAGLTVRALHHYDRMGLLKPSRRNTKGYRLYTQQDLFRLEQIVVLKHLGLPLREIGRLLQDDAMLPEILKRQRAVLHKKRSQLDRAIRAIGRTEEALRQTGEPDWNMVAQIIKEMEMENDWSKQYYSEEAKEKIEARKPLWNSKLQEEVSAKWTALFADVEAALGEDPAGAHGQELAGRWKALVGGFTGGDPEIQKGLNRMYADQDNWPAEQKKSYAIKPEIMDWILRAMRSSK